MMARMRCWGDRSDVKCGRQGRRLRIHAGNEALRQASSKTKLPEVERDADSKFSCRLRTSLHFDMMEEAGYQFTAFSRSMYTFGSASHVSLHG